SVGTFSDKVSGELPMNFGGVSSFGPPLGVPCRAQEIIKIEMKNITKNRIIKICCKLRKIKPYLYLTLKRHIHPNGHAKFTGIGQTKIITAPVKIDTQRTEISPTYVFDSESIFHINFIFWCQVRNVG